MNTIRNIFFGKKEPQTPKFKFGQKIDRYGKEMTVTGLEWNESQKQFNYTVEDETSTAVVLECEIKAKGKEISYG